MTRGLCEDVSMQYIDRYPDNYILHSNDGDDSDGKTREPAKIIEARATPAALRGFSSGEISAACSCLHIRSFLIDTTKLVEYHSISISGMVQ